MGLNLEEYKLDHFSGALFGWSISLVLMIVGVEIIGLDIIGGIVAFIRSRKEKGSDIDEKMKKIFLSSVVLLIIGLSIILLMLLSIFLIVKFIPLVIFGYIYIFLPPLLIIGLLIGFIGLYGIRLYRSKPEMLRNYLLNRRKFSDRFRPKTASK